MISRTIGFSLLGISLILKATLTHNLTYWGTVKTWSLILAVTGLIFVGHRLMDWIDDAKPGRLFNPVAWLVYLLKIVFTLSALALLTMGVEFAGQTLNQQLKEYYLSKEVETTNGRIVAETKEPYTIIRYRFNVKTNYERFFIVEYSTQEGLIRQGIKPDTLTKVGLNVTVLYSKKHPTFFKLKG